MNASICKKYSIENCKNIGYFGLNNRNYKGLEILNMLRIHDLYAPLTFLFTKIVLLGEVLIKKNAFLVRSMVNKFIRFFSGFSGCEIWNPK